MNKFQKEVHRRMKKVTRIIGHGDLTRRCFIRLIRRKLKLDLKRGNFEL